MYGSVRSQLTHEYVQNWTATTRPRSAAAVSGSELSYSDAPSRGVSDTSTRYSDRRDQASVDQEVRAGHVARAFAGEQDNEIGDLGGFGEAAGRRLARLAGADGI